MTNEDNLITIKKSSIKDLLLKFFVAIIEGYIWLNKESTTFWRRLLSGHSTARKLIEDDAILLFFNTLLFAAIGIFLGGLIGNIMFNITFLNILAFLVVKMQWVQKLLK